MTDNLTPEQQNKLALLQEAYARSEAIPDEDKTDFASPDKSAGPIGFASEDGTNDPSTDSTDAPNPDQDARPTDHDHEERTAANMVLFGKKQQPAREVMTDSRFDEILARSNNDMNLKEIMQPGYMSRRARRSGVSTIAVVQSMGECDPNRI